MAPVSASDVMGIRVIVIGVVFSVLAVAVVSGRIWARRIRKTQLKLSDVLAVVALFFTLGLNVTIIAAAFVGGTGQHMTSLSLSEDIALAKAFLAAGVLWALAIACVKLSILAFYTSIFRNAVFEAMAYALAALSVSLMIAVFLATLLICRPLAYNWNKNVKGTCGDTNALYLGGGIANLILDVAIVVFPMPMLWGLQLKQSRKLGLSFIFGLGTFVCIISILRIVSIHRLNSLDLSYSSAADGIWSILEPSLGIVAACLPIMQPVFSRMSDITSTLFLRTRGTSQRSLRASSKQLPDQDQKPLTKRDPEDRMYPLSNFAETVNEVETDNQPYDAEASPWKSGQKDIVDGRRINVERGYAVHSETRV